MTVSAAKPEEKRLGWFVPTAVDQAESCVKPAAEGRCHIKQSERENDQIAILELIDLAVICTRPMRANILNVTEPHGHRLWNMAGVALFQF